MENGEGRIAGSIGAIPTRQRAEAVLFAASAYFGVRAQDITGDVRHRTLVRARAVAAFVMNEIGFTSSEIGIVMHRERSGISSQIANVRGLLGDGDAAMKRDVVEVRHLVDGSTRELDELKLTVKALTERCAALEDKFAALLDEVRRSR